MRLFICADIEGTTGIAHWDETDKPKSDYYPFADQMTKEVNAACEGALDAGFEKITVKDAHDSARNIDFTQLPEKVRLIRDWTKNPLSMMAGIDEGFDACVFTGFHVGAHSSGNPLAHTMNTTIYSVKINGIEASELHLNAYAAAYYGVPLVCVTGDEAVCEEAKQLNPNIKTVPVFEGMGDATKSIHPNLALRKIRETVTAALKEDLSKYVIPLPESFEIEISFKQHHLAYHASYYPGVERINATTVKYTAKDYYEVLRTFYFIH
ncbi:M55 family metallopeptidase [Geosporobacter ferrireducens]|uniref:Amino acid amidase n=1 Tax=Geosporobacter ferrireducens TaxID=1424294 RepID=A0A1D8GMG7_9FIRM|nr:M55 family metallopeptidase [Geosporobacter ferrireducens]AOT72113.1 amino acid amidase [Geosporobacter ferrireducens]MTI56001.1 amino acid amidase [Geosporobacter ferrireducens]